MVATHNFPPSLSSEDALTHVLAAHITALLALSTRSLSLPSSTAPSSVFFSITLPDIPVASYARRLVRYAQCSPAAYPGALVILTRLAAADPSLALTAYNLHRLVLTSLMVAAKSLDDHCFSNAHYARVGGISSVAEINRLEITLLHTLNFSVFISRADYADAEQQLLARLPSVPFAVPLAPVLEPQLFTQKGFTQSGSPLYSPEHGSLPLRSLVRVSTDGTAFRAAAAKVMASRKADAGNCCARRVAGRHSQSWHAPVSAELY